MSDKRRPLKAKKPKATLSAVEAGASLKDKLEGPGKKGASGGKPKR